MPAVECDVELDGGGARDVEEEPMGRVQVETVRPGSHVWLDERGWSLVTDVRVDAEIVSLEHAGGIHKRRAGDLVQTLDREEDAAPDEVARVTSIGSRLPAVGVFTSISTRDGEGRRRDGEDVVEVNELGDDVVEVRFRDGQWMLCAPDEVGPGEGGTA